MNPICREEFTNFLEKSEISLAPEERNTGSELISTSHNKRIVVVYLPSDESDEYIKNILDILFSLENEWVVFPRFGSLENMIGVRELIDAHAVRVGPNDIKELIDRMVSIQRNHSVIENDPYALSGSGEIIVPWDHHIFSGGLGLFFSSIKKSTEFISKLNELGAEFDVIFSNA